MTEETEEIHLTAIERQFVAEQMFIIEDVTNIYAVEIAENIDDPFEFGEELQSAVNTDHWLGCRHCPATDDPDNNGKIPMTIPDVHQHIQHFHPKILE